MDYLVFGILVFIFLYWLYTESSFFKDLDALDDAYFADDNKAMNDPFFGEPLMRGDDTPPFPMDLKELVHEARDLEQLFDILDALELGEDKEEL